MKGSKRTVCHHYSVCFPRRRLICSDLLNCGHGLKVGVKWCSELTPRWPSWRGEHRFYHSRCRGCTVGLQRMNEDARCGIHRTHTRCTQHSPHACTPYPHACTWIPRICRTFQGYHMKRLGVRASVASEEGPGAVWLIHDSPGALHPL